MEQEVSIAITGAETELGKAVAKHFESLGYEIVATSGSHLPSGYEKADILACCHVSQEELDWLECTPQEWQKMRQNNFDSMFTCVQAYANARVAAQAQGVALLVTHDDSNSGASADVLWSVTSWGVRGIVRNTAAAYARKGVRVNGVCAGAADIDNSDVATLMAFLAQNAHITGQTIPVARGYALL